jgi:predicted double-glycine peptidase
MQANNYSCGVGAVQAVAQYYGVWGYHATHVKALGTTPENGTHPLAMVAYLRKLGLDARLEEGMTLAGLRRWVDAGVPVIVDYQAWNGGAHVDYAKAWEDGHYSVVVGYNRDHVFLEDPSLLGTVGWLTNAEFEARWHDYETEHGKRREYRRMGIVVRGKAQPQPSWTHID